MKVTTSTKEVKKKILAVILASNNEPEEQPKRFEAFLKIATNHTQVFDRAFELALKAKIASPVDPTFLQAEYYSVKEAVEKARLAAADERIKKLEAEQLETKLEAAPTETPEVAT